MMRDKGRDGEEKSLEERRRLMVVGLGLCRGEYCESERKDCD